MLSVDVTFFLLHPSTKHTDTVCAWGGWPWTTSPRACNCLLGVVYNGETDYTSTVLTDPRDPLLARARGRRPLALVGTRSLRSTQPRHARFDSLAPTLELRKEEQESNYRSCDLRAVVHLSLSPRRPREWSELSNQVTIAAASMMLRNSTLSMHTTETHIPASNQEGRRLGGRWAKVGTPAWSQEIGVQPEHMRLEPWASPVLHEWCDHLAQPRIFVVLTAAVRAFINLARRGLRDQQRNTTERQEMYQQVVRRWAVASNVAVVFAENSGADLLPIEAVVPAWRKPNFEFISVPSFPERLPSRGRPDVGRLEARTIVHALNTSQLLATRCPNDVVFGITSRYFVHDF